MTSPVRRRRNDVDIQTAQNPVGLGMHLRGGPGSEAEHRERSGSSCYGIVSS